MNSGWEKFSKRLEEKYPVREIFTEEETHSSLNLVIKNGLSIQGMATLTTGVFLVGFALQLGASNFQIGLLASIPVLMQAFQIPAIYLVESLRVRRALCVYSSFCSRGMLLLVALIPFFASGETGLRLLFLAIFIQSTIAALLDCSWNSWMRDLVPHDRMGAFFGKRLFFTTFLGMVLGLCSGVYIDGWNRAFPEDPLHGYSILFFMGLISGMLGVHYLSQTPEPRMARHEEKIKISAIVKIPFQDPNFKKLLFFSLFWSFAVNLAAPFFTVYLLKWLELKMALVVALGVLSQLMNLAFFRIWGKFADRFGNKAVLGLAGWLFMVTVLAWTFTTLPEKHALTVPLLVLIHMAMGMSTAGVALASGNIGLKLAPRGKATSYLASIAFVNSLAAGLAPFLGGLFADYFARREFSWTLNWTSPVSDLHFEVLSFRQWDFLFFFSFAIGLFALRRLSYVQDVGEVKEKIDVGDLISEVRIEMRNLSTMGGLRYMIQAPVLLLSVIFSRNGHGELAGAEPRPGEEGPAAVQKDPDAP